MTSDGCGFLLFSLKSCLIFFVIHFILILYEVLANSWYFSMKRFESVSFLGQYGISAKSISSVKVLVIRAALFKSAWIALCLQRLGIFDV